MKFSILFYSILICYSGLSQPSNHVLPNIPEKGKSIYNFLPYGWKIIDSVAANFNNDNLLDVALVIQKIDSERVMDTDCISNYPFYPKMMIVLFKNQDNSFRLSTTASKLFGNCNWGVQGHDPFDYIAKRKTSIEIQFSTGGSLITNMIYFFQFRNSKWYLVGATHEIYQQGESDLYTENLNMLTNIKENYDKDSRDGKKQNYKKTHLKPMKLIQLSNFVNDSELPFTKND